MASESAPSELRDYLAVLWRRKVLIVLAVATTVGAALLYSNEQTPLYRSSAAVLVAPISLPVQGQATNTFVNMASEQLIASSPEVAALADQQVEADGFTPGTISIDSSLDEQTLTFTASAPTPRSARLTAQSYADAYLENRRTQLQQDLQDGENAIKDVIEELNTQIAAAEDELASAQTTGNAPRETVLKLRISSLSNLLGTQQASLGQVLLAKSAPVGQIVAPAYLPSSPSSPNVRRNVLLALLLGLALGVAFGFLAERLDERVRLRTDVESITGASLFGRIPAARMPEDGILILERPDAEASEAFRMLRAQVMYGASQLGTGVIMLTSVYAGEGKTTVAMNLAAALAQAGKRTVLVSADLRQATADRFFDVVDRRGLSEVLRQDLDPVDFLIPSAVKGLSILPGGGRVENPSELVGSGALASAMARLGSHADFVIVDAPPVLGVSDAVSMASAIRSVLLVADARRSRRAAISEAVIALRAIGAQLLGVVLTHVSHRDHPAYSYAAYAVRQRENDGNGQETSSRSVSEKPPPDGRRG